MNVNGLYQIINGKSVPVSTGTGSSDPFIESRVSALENKVVSGSTTQEGLVQLSSSTNSSSETTAATSKAVKTLADSIANITDNAEQGLTAHNSNPDAHSNFRTYKGATSSANGVAGLVPAATKEEYNKFLRADGSWQEPEKSLVYKGATKDSPGISGLVPSAASSERDYFFKGDGTFQNIVSRKYDFRKVTPINLYIRTDGNDSNSGLENTPQGALASIQEACTRIAQQIELGFTSIIINIGEGEFDNSLITLHGIGDATTITIKGSGKDTTKLVRNNNNTLHISSTGLPINIQDLSLISIRTNSTGYYMNYVVGGDVRFTNVLFKFIDESNKVENDNGVEMLCVTNSVCYVHNCEFLKETTGTPTNKGEAIRTLYNSTCTITGTLSINGLFISSVVCLGGKVIASEATSVTGVVEGIRYRSANGGLIYTRGKGQEFFPGTLEGYVETESGSIYY